jgi:hypothetical protein
MLANERDDDVDASQTKILVYFVTDRLKLKKKPGRRTKQTEASTSDSHTALLYYDRVWFRIEMFLSLSPSLDLSLIRRRRRRRCFVPSGERERERENWAISMNAVDNEMCILRPRQEKGIVGPDRIDHRRRTERKIEVTSGTWNIAYGIQVAVGEKKVTRDEERCGGSI